MAMQKGNNHEMELNNGNMNNLATDINVITVPIAGIPETGEDKENRITKILFYPGFSFLRSN